MYPRKKGRSKKVYLAIILLVVLVGSSAAVVYYGFGSAKPVNVGVQVGDTFTYNIKGYATLTGLDAVVPDYFYQYNQTEFYKVTITDVTDSLVSLSTQWHFMNGTDRTEEQIIDVANGNKTSTNGFWAIYAAELNVGDRLRPRGHDGLTVNKTTTQTYADSSRDSNYFEIGNEFKDMTDPTGNTLRYDLVNLYFDRETGMLQTLNNYQSYNNPQMTLFITWQLTESTLWKVK